MSSITDVNTGLDEDIQEISRSLQSIAKSMKELIATLDMFAEGQPADFWERLGFKEETQ